MKKNNKRITIFAGHYGSGKTTLSLNYAFWLKEFNDNIVICDLDIVNPYFRTADALKAIQEKGIKLIMSKYAGSNLDIPSVSAETQSIFDDKSITAVIDLGGDDRGALALGRYAAGILAENDYDMLLVVNKYRPLTGNIEDAAVICKEIEAASKVKFTGIVNNSNIGAETTAESVSGSFDFVGGLSERLSLPVKMTAAKHDLTQTNNKINNDIFSIKLYPKQEWQI